MHVATRVYSNMICITRLYYNNDTDQKNWANMSFMQNGYFIHSAEVNAQLNLLKIQTCNSKQSVVHAVNMS